jgi:hypothetical protein
MPTYYIPNSRSSTQLMSPKSSANGCCCPSSTNFLATLTDKLYLMAQSLKEQFDYLRLHCTDNQQMAQGVIIAEIAIKAAVTVKWEYVIYIQMFGPPLKGQFDPVYLDQIRDGIACGTIKVPG